MVGRDATIAASSDPAVVKNARLSLDIRRLTLYRPHGIKIISWDRLLRFVEGGAIRALHKRNERCAGGGAPLGRSRRGGKVSGKGEPGEVRLWGSRTTMLPSRRFPPKLRFRTESVRQRPSDPGGVATSSHYPVLSPSKHGIAGEAANKLEPVRKLLDWIAAVFGKARRDQEQAPRLPGPRKRAAEAGKGQRVRQADRRRATVLVVEIAHEDDAEGAHHAVVLLDGHVLAGHEMVAVEFEAGLVILAALGVVVERP